MIVALLLLLGGAPPPASSVAAAPVAPAPAAPPRPPLWEQRAPMVADMAFSTVCVERFGAASPADYARGSEAQAAGIRREFPAETAVVRLDGAEGHGCRVTYSGRFVADLWGGWNGIYQTPAPTPTFGCKVVESTPDRLRAHCEDHRPTPPRAGEVLIQRTGAAVVASLIPS